MNHYRFLPFIVALCVILTWYVMYECVRESCILFSSYVIVMLRTLEPFTVYAACLLLPALLAARIPQKSFYVWVRFAFVWTGVASVLILYTPKSYGFWSSVSWGPNATALVLGTLFIIGSLVQFGICSLSRKAENSPADG
jgi:hypothetical protein